MNISYYAQIFDSDIEFDNFIIIVQNSVMKQHYIFLIKDKLCKYENTINVKNVNCGETDMQCGVYTREGLLLFEDEAELEFKW